MLNNSLEVAEKKFPEDYTEKQIEMLKQIVIERLKQIPDNLRLSIG